MKRLISAVLFLAAVLGMSIRPALAQQRAESVHIYVFVMNKETNDPLNAMTVFYDEPASNCSGQHQEHVAAPPTTRQGETRIDIVTCSGPAMITVNGNAEFDTAVKTVELLPGRAGYNVLVKMEPKGRVVHIRTQGKENGSLVPVRALIYDQSGQRIAITDDQGFATVRYRFSIGETVKLQAKAPHWGATSASYIVGASEAGTRLTRSEDYINFVFGEEETPKQQLLSLDIRVSGMQGGKRIPIDHATIYDERGRSLGTTDARGRLWARIETALGETFQLKAEAYDWKTETQSVLARAERGIGSAGSPSLYHAVTFVLQPNAEEVHNLTVEVLSRETDKPLKDQVVDVYRPTSFPGMLEISNTTDDKGEVHFDSFDLSRALFNNEIRIKVGGGDCYPAVIENVPVSLMHGEAPRYLVYLRSLPPGPTNQGSLQACSPR